MRTTSRVYFRDVGRKSLERHQGNIRRDRTIDADIHLTPDVYVFLLQKQSEHAGKEIAGFGVVSEENVLHWASIVAVGEPSSVTMSVADGAWSEEEAVKETGQSSNMQIHSHPGLSCFWSSTDTTDQFKRIDAIMDYVETGEYWFLVFDASKNEFLSRRVVWDKKVILYNDGTVYCGNVDIGKRSYAGSPITEVKPTVYASGSYTQYGNVTTHPATASKSADWQQAAGKKKDEAAKAAEGAPKLAGDVTEKIKAYYLDEKSRVDLSSINNWVVYQAMIEVSFDLKITLRKVAETLLEHEIKYGYVKKKTYYLYPAFASRCQVTQLGIMDAREFLEVFLYVYDSPATSQTPGEILLSQAFDANKAGRVSFAFVAHKLCLNTSKLDNGTVNKYCSFQEEPDKAKREDFAFWARMQDHNVLSLAAGGVMYELRTTKLVVAEAMNAKLNLLASFAMILNSGKEGVIAVGGNQRVDNFDLCVLRRALSFTRPTMCDLYGKVIKTETKDGVDWRAVADEIEEYCVEIAKSTDSIAPDSILRMYDKIGSLSVEDSVKLFEYLDGKQKELDIQVQWILSLLFTGSSGLIPMPLILFDILTATRGQIDVDDFDELLINAISLGVGRNMLMAVSQIDFSLLPSPYVDMTDDEFFGVGMLSGEQLALIESEVI